MTKENNKVDINKLENDIDTLFKQIVNDLLSIKELYRKLEEVEEKISQIKYVDNTLVKKLKKEYENLKKILLDENVQLELNSKLEETNSQLEHNVNETVIDRNRQFNTIRRSNLNKTFNIYKFPLKFNFNNNDIPIEVLSDGYNYLTSFDVSNYKNNSTKTVYLSTTKGNNSNDGLTENKPVSTLAKALSISTSGDTIYIIDDENTTYDRSSWVATGEIDKSINIIAKNKIIVFKGNNPSWLKTAGYNNVYEVSNKFVIEVVNLNGAPLKYKKVNSIDEVDLNPLSWYTDETKVYVNCKDEVNNQLILPIMKTGYPCLINTTTSNMKIYLENIDFVGGDENVKILGDSTYYLHEFYAKKCRFLFSTKFSSVRIWDCKLGYFQDCECGYSSQDGFSYSAPYSRCSPDFIEVNCKGYCNGDNSKNSPDTHNGSTGHGNCRGIRINSIYNDNVGGNLVESGTSKTVNLGCVAYDSKSVTSNSSQGFGLQTSTGEMWIENCIAFGNINDMFCADGSTIHIRKSQYDTKLGGGNWDCDERL